MSKKLIGVLIVLICFSGYCFGNMIKYKKELKASSEREYYYQTIIENNEKISKLEKEITEKEIEVQKKLMIINAKVAEIDGNIVVIDFNGEFHYYEYIGGNPTE